MMEYVLRLTLKPDTASEYLNLALMPSTSPSSIKQKQSCDLQIEDVDFHSLL